jgi:hypothetical protein
LRTNDGTKSFPFWPSTPEPGYRGQLGDACQADYATRRAGLTVNDCDFYHTSVLRDGSVVEGPWDHRGAEDAYVGGCSFDGRKVLELGPATGHFTYFLESRGADVVSFEVGYDTSIDLLPPMSNNAMDDLRVTLMTKLEAVNNSWWYLHREKESAARMVYGNIYDLPDDLCTFDDSFFGSILLHLRDPFAALEQASHHTAKRMIVTEMVYGDLDDPLLLNRIANAVRWRLRRRPGQIGAGDPGNLLRFAPERSNRGPSVKWWEFSPGSIMTMLERLGFQRRRITFHSQKYRIGSLDEEPKDVAMFTVVGERSG